MARPSSSIENKDSIQLTALNRSGYAAWDGSSIEAIKSTGNTFKIGEAVGAINPFYCF